MDISAHALGLFDLTNDAFTTVTLGASRLDREALAQVCGGCGNLQWGG